MIGSKTFKAVAGRGSRFSSLLGGPVRGKLNYQKEVAGKRMGRYID